MANVKEIQEKMLENEHIEDIVILFKALSDETRMKIVSALQQDELCVSDIAEIVDMTSSSVSHQLKQLKFAGLIKARRDGKNIYYSLDDDHVGAILEIALAHVTHLHH